MSIGSNAEVANIVLNTNFCYLLLRLLKGISSRPSSRDAYSNSNSRRDANSSDTVGSTTRVVAVTVLASMLRFATYIQPPSHKNKDDHLLPVLVSVMKSLEDISGGSMGNSQKGSINSSSRQDIKIKRRCMAALGETLFYISSQEDSNTDQGSWALPMGTISAVVRCLRNDSDEAIRHYAVKTIENVMAQGASEHKRKFVTVDIASRLLELSQHGRNSTMQASCGMGLSHMFLFVMTLDPQNSGRSTVVPQLRVQMIVL